MKKPFEIIKFLIRLTSAGVACIMLFSFWGCAGKAKIQRELELEAPVAYPESTDMASHYCVPANMKEIAASGLITLLFDENSSSIGVRVTSNNSSKLWSALPEYTESETLSDEAEIISLEVIHESGRYFLNSQDCSVANASLTWGNTENGFSVIYYITNNPSCLKNIGSGASDDAYSAAADDNILYKVAVNYSLKDGCLYADLEWKNLGNEEDILVNIGFLEYFGANNISQEGDFILVPDGSGALINTASLEVVDPISIAVYGNDIGENEPLVAVAPVYGMKSGNDAFATVIEQGDAVATVNAAKARNNSSYNHVGATFTVTPSQRDEETEFFSDNTYTDNITLCFRFLSGADATYAGLAAACREQFVRNYTLSSTGVLSGEYMPVLVNVIGQAKKDGIFGFNKKLTTYSQAQDILNRIKSKGINNVYLRYSAALSGGFEAKNAQNASLLSSLGGVNDFQTLNDYASSLNFNVFVDVSLLSGSEGGFETVSNLTDSKSVVVRETLLTKTGFVSDKARAYLSDLDTLEKTVLKALEAFTEYDSTGFCVTDAGEILYTDFSNDIDRQNAAAFINEELAPLATQNIVMIQNGNFYSLKNADIVCDIPMSCRHTQSEAYISVPFVQLILHGIVEFSGSPINLESDSKTAFLKCIEYGAIPSFALTNNSFDDSEEYNKIFGTDNWLSFMYNCYSQSSDIFGDLRDSRITDHFEVSEGVYCTEYESTTKIYVNYTEMPITVSGITVEPMSFFRVN